MKSVFLIYEKGRAANYGIGTYIHQMTDFMKTTDEVSFNLVELLSDMDELEVTETGNYRKFCFPKVFHDKSGDYKIYQKRVGVLLGQLINEIAKPEKLIFQFNYFEHSPLIDSLKEQFPESKIIFTIHFQMWCFELSGNKTHFRRIIASEKDELLSQEEKKIIEVFSDEKRIFDTVDSIICLAQFTKNLLIKDYQVPAKKLIVICNGVEKRKHVTRLQKEKIRKKLQISLEEKILLFVGRLDPIKGVDYLIQAFKIVLQSEPDCRLIIIGDGDYSPHLQRANKVWHKITFTGKLAKKEIEQFYQIADVGVLPSFHEQCSYTALEMMSWGLPLVGSSSTGLREMIENYPNGELVKIKESKDRINFSPQKISQAILSKLNQPDCVKSTGKMELYDLNTIRKQYLEVYNHV